MPTANDKILLRGNEILERWDTVADRNHYHFQIRGLTKPTRDIINEVIQKILDRVGANPLASFHLFSGLMEALLNAVKGNTRFVIFQDELLQKLVSSGEAEKGVEAEALLQTILETEPLRDAMQRYIVPQKIKKTVQQILVLQDKKRNKKLELNDTEKSFLAGLREKTDKYGLKISLKVELRPEELYIRIRNDAPIMGIDLERIQRSRERHAELAKDGRSGEFFRPDFLDEKESAGFGIAMIDEGFYSMGLKPLECFNIQTGKHATTVYFNYPFSALQNMEF